jgi:hypothetical protein
VPANPMYIPSNLLLSGGVLCLLHSGESNSSQSTVGLTLTNFSQIHQLLRSLSRLLCPILSHQLFSVRDWLDRISTTLLALLSLPTSRHAVRCWVFSSHSGHRLVDLCIWVRI